MFWPSWPSLPALHSLIPTPVFSGSFSTYWAYSFAGESLSDDNSLGMTIDLGATIDDFNTVSVSVGLADAMYWDDVYDDDKIQSDTAAAAAVRSPLPICLKMRLTIAATTCG